MYANLARESYKDHLSRNDLHGYKYIYEDSTPDYAVYKKGDDHIMVYKGTSNTSDIIPDLAIAAGVQDRNRRFIEAEQAFVRLRKKHKKNWTTVGHSLGGTQAMWVAQRNKVPSHAFNPGYSSIADDRIDTSYKDHNIYLIDGDPISNGMKRKEIEGNITVLPSVSFDPISNHSILNFIQVQKSPIYGAPLETASIQPTDSPIENQLFNNLQLK